jgi:hypothetical protein
MKMEAFIAMGISYRLKKVRKPEWVIFRLWKLSLCHIKPSFLWSYL